MKIGKLKKETNKKNHTFADNLTVALWDPQQRIQQTHVWTTETVR